jgi:trimeric autotransporter adhesin
MAFTFRNRTFWSIAATLSLQAAPTIAATCPFDTGASDALNDGVELTRYALGITGSPMTASTRYASLDPLQVKNNIECVGCALDMNGDGQIDTVDTTIIARHLVGFKGAAVTNGLALGAGSRNTTAAVTSFLANGCAVGGAISAFTQGGNAFGAPAVLGTTDGQPLTLGIGGGAGVRIAPSTTVGEPNIIGGHADNGAASTAIKGAFIGGGGATGGFPNSILANYGVIGGGAGNKVHGNYGAVGGGAENQAGGSLSGLPFTTVGGGFQNSALGESSVVAGGRQNSIYSTGSYSAVGGGRYNIASGSQATVGGGDSNSADGLSSTVPGGFGNTASGEASFAAGQYAIAAARTFIWNSYNTSNNLPTRTDSFRVQAANGFDVAFGPNRDYFVAFNAETAGFIITTSTGAKLSAGGVWTNNSDRAKRRDFSPINAQNAQDILRKVVSLPLSTWSYFAEDAKIRHIGPMAQDFWKAFGLGYDDKTMTDIDARGVTLAAIQGLDQIVKDRDVEIAQLKSRLAAIERRLRLNGAR